MNNFFTTKAIFGKWKLTIDTPFGEECCTLIVDDSKVTKVMDQEAFTSAVISDGKNSINFNNGTISNDAFEFSTTVEFPIKANIILFIHKIENENIFGTVTVDEYLRCAFSGVK